MYVKPVEVAGKDRVLSFIESVDLERERDREMEMFRHSDVYKRNLMNKECEKGKEECLRHVMGKCYRNAIPLSDEYKAAMCNDLDGDIDKHCPNGLLFYFREGLKKGSCGPRCKKLYEAVCKEVDQSYEDKMVHPEKYKEEDLVFKMDPEMQTRMDVLAQDLELDDITDLINRSVKSSTESEIRRAREEKEKNKELEKELASDLSINTESAINDALEIRGLNRPRIYQPSVFEGIMISRTKEAENGMYESYTYHALEDYGLDTDENSKMYQAMVESVKEFTWVTMEDAFLRAKPRDLKERRTLANEYAQCVK